VPAGCSLSDHNHTTILHSCTLTFISCNAHINITVTPLSKPRILTCNAIREWSCQGRVSVRCKMWPRQAVTSYHVIHAAHGNDATVLRVRMYVRMTISHSTTRIHNQPTDPTRGNRHFVPPSFQVNDLKHWSVNGDDLITFHASMF
jgi:hypothetical protein